MKESQYSVEPNRARHLSIWLLRCWCYKAGESTGTQMHEPGDIWSLSITIRSHLYPHRAFHTSSISSTGSTQCTYSLFENMKSMYTKGKGQGNQFRWERLDSVTMTASGWCRHNVPAAEPNFYKPNVKTEALLNGVNGGEDQLSTALLSRKKLQNAMIKHFLTHVSALLLSNCVSLLFPESIFLWSHFCLFQRKTITTTKRVMQMSPHPTCVDAPFQYALYDLALAVWLHKIIINMLL